VKFKIQIRGDGIKLSNCMGLGSLEEIGHISYRTTEQFACHDV